MCLSLSLDHVTTVEQMKTPLMIAAYDGRPRNIKFLRPGDADANKQVANFL
jgi:hypothetical protein